jgi:hypothetical protein
MDRAELERRLKGWAAEYGGGRYENIGYQSRNMLQTLVEHQGFVPDSRGFIPIPIRSAADEVEQTVNRMEADGWYKQGRVLRCDYFLPNIPMDVRLRNLRHIGVQTSRAGYYDFLAQAKAFVAGALTKVVAA